MRTHGFTLVETLVVLAVTAVLLALALTYTRGGGTLRAAHALKASLLWARTNAVWSGVPVAVTELPGGAGLLLTQLGAGSTKCGNGSELARFRLRDYPGVTLAAGLPRGVVWLPDGSGRSCDGGGVISATMRLLGGQGGAKVVLSSLGRVRVEADP